MFSSLISQNQPNTELIKFTGDEGPYDYGFGASSSISGNFAIVGAPSEYENDIKCGAAYIYHFNGTSWVRHTKLIASDPAGYAYFGNSVYISGNHAIVGAVGADNYGYQSGVAYIFHYNGAQWNEKIKIFPSDPSESDRFGASVCISGDFAIIGAENDGETDSGAAYIFQNNGTTWNQQAKLTSFEAVENEAFGKSVSISGNNAIIGAPGNSENGYNAGAIYFFHYDGADWNEQDKLLSSENSSNLWFGSNTSISGNYAFASASGDNTNGDNSGAVYTYFFNGISWSEQDKLYASDANAYDGFGSSVNISDDYASVGAVGTDNDSTTSSGSSYIFERIDSDWIEQNKIVASDGMNYARFGTSAGVSGEFAIVGTYDPIYSSDVCAAYIYGPPIPVFWTHPEDQTGVCDGEQVSFSVSGEDFESYQWQVNEGIGFQNIDDVGIYSNSEKEELFISTVNSGMNNYQYRCVVSNADGEGISNIALLTIDGPELELTCNQDTAIELTENQLVYTVNGNEFDPVVNDDNCGNAEISNSFNNMSSLAGAEIPVGTTTIKWTIRDDDNTDTCINSITIDEYNSNQWFQMGNALEGDFSGDNFGRSVSLNSDGSMLAVGAWKNGANGTNAGHVKIFRNADDEWVQVGGDILGETQKYFGHSISLNTDGSIVAIGANPIGSPSYVEVYKNISGEWTLLGNNITGDGYVDEFGYKVSLNAEGTILAIGDPGYNPDGFSRGAVLVYEYKSGLWKLLGSPIIGEHTYDSFGSAISLNSEGNILAVGAHNNSDNGSGSGNVRVFENVDNSWVQIGNSIVGEHSGDASGVSISLNSSGSIVAIGAVSNEDNGYQSGHVRVFENRNDNWIQMGSDIDGEGEGDECGRSVSLNSDGTVVAIGSSNNDDNGYLSGHVRVFKYTFDMWTKISESISGDAEKDKLGFDVSLSSDGAVVAAGAPFNDANGNDAGHVKVFRNPSQLNAIETELSRKKMIIYPNPTSGKVSVVSEVSEINRITVFDVAGNIIFSKNNPQEYEVIDLSRNRTGLYFIRVATESNTYTTKIIIN